MDTDLNVKGCKRHLSDSDTDFKTVIRRQRLHPAPNLARSRQRDQESEDMEKHRLTRLDIYSPCRICYGSFVVALLWFSLMTAVLTSINGRGSRSPDRRKLAFQDFNRKRWDGDSFSAQRTKRKLKRQRGNLPVRP